MRKPSNHYKSIQVKTANRGDLLMMLYDGCFRFLKEAHAALLDGDRARAGDRLDRAYAILSELVATLRREVYPELCDNLESVYLFCMSQIVQANLNQDAGVVVEVMGVLQPIRCSFEEAVRQVNTGEPSGETSTGT